MRAVYTGPPPSFATAKALQAGSTSTVSLLAPAFSAPATTTLPKVSSIPKQSSGTAPAARPSGNVASYFTRPASGKTSPVDKNQSAPHQLGTKLSLQATCSAHSIPKPYHAGPAGPSKENRSGPVVSTLPPVQLAGGKRRLGMGRAPDGFSSQPIKRLKDD